MAVAGAEQSRAEPAEVVLLLEKCKKVEVGHVPVVMHALNTFFLSPDPRQENDNYIPDGVNTSH